MSRAEFYYEIQKEVMDDKTILPSDAQQRKDIPLVRGVVDYFPSALIEVARVSVAGNKQHNPDSDELQWTRGKSTDHADSLLRHLIDRGKIDSDGIRHSAKVAWRALAMLQEELEADLGAPPGRASKFTGKARIPAPRDVEVETLR